MILDIAMTAACTGVTINSCANYFLLRHIKNASTLCEDEIAVLLPMRNEAENVVDLVKSLQAQTGLTNVRFHCLDDQSTDNTFSLLQSATASDARFELHRGAPLVEGWIGKPHALQQALGFSRSKIVVIVDSDVRLTPNAIAGAVTTMQKLNLDFISAYPRQIASTWPERFIQPLLQWSWLSTVPLRVAEKVTNSSLAVANGQFFIATSAALSQVDGFRRIKAEVLDDISLARVLLKSGSHGTVADASEVASCRMYTSWREIKQGYGKSLRVAFRTPIGFLVTVAFLLLTGVAPIITSIGGSLIGILSFGLIIFSRVLSAASSGGKIRDSIAHPLSTILLIYLICYSIIMRRKITWKGRKL